MSRTRIRRAVVSLIMLAAIVGAIEALRESSRLREEQSASDDVLYLSSSKSLKRFSLGYTSLLADVYWTRAVQYFGARHLARSSHYTLLYPLLDITTDLDPHLIVAYQNGALFLSGSPPGGAGEPDRAVTLLEKGIKANPDFWRLYFTLGFIQYMDRKDYKAAREAFDQGSQVPGAMPWMKVMAATMAQHAGERDTAVAIWGRLYESTQDPGIRENALRHLVGFRVEAELEQLQALVRQSHDRTGKMPSGWTDLIRAGLLGGIPLDPTGRPYVLASDGNVLVQAPERFSFTDRNASTTEK